MTMHTIEESQGVVNVERSLGRLEGQTEVLTQVVLAQGTRESSQKPDAKSVERSLGRLEGQTEVLTQVVLAQGTRESSQKPDAKADNVLYWVLGIVGFTITTTIELLQLAMIFAQL